MPLHYMPSPARTRARAHSPSPSFVAGGSGCRASCPCCGCGACPFPGCDFSSCLGHGLCLCRRNDPGPCKTLAGAADTVSRAHECGWRASNGRRSTSVARGPVRLHALYRCARRSRRVRPTCGQHPRGAAAHGCHAHAGQGRGAAAHVTVPASPAAMSSTMAVRARTGP